MARKFQAPKCEERLGHPAYLEKLEKWQQLGAAIFDITTFLQDMKSGALNEERDQHIHELLNAVLLAYMKFHSKENKICEERRTVSIANCLGEIYSEAYNDPSTLEHCNRKIDELVADRKETFHITKDEVEAYLKLTEMDLTRGLNSEKNFTTPKDLAYIEMGKVVGKSKSTLYEYQRKQKASAKKTRKG
jgi:hypothetical protein